MFNKRVQMQRGRLARTLTQIRISLSVDEFVVDDEYQQLEVNSMEPSQRGKGKKLAIVGWLEVHPRGVDGLGTHFYRRIECPNPRQQPKDNNVLEYDCRKVPHV